ncbi:hypothetical protein ACEPAH_7381 [Sanghuangporus vaninii]
MVLKTPLIVPKSSIFISASSIHRQGGNTTESCVAFLCKSGYLPGCSLIQFFHITATQHEVVKFPTCEDRESSRVSGSSEDNLDERSVKDGFWALKERTIAEKRLLRKLNTRFLPSIILIYIMNYIDSAPSGDPDVSLDIQYDTTVAILYTSYSAAQIPPSFYIRLCIVWEVMSALTGLREALAASSLVVYFGFPEAAFFPGAIYLLPWWYTRKLAFRTSILYSGDMSSNAFGSLIAVGILGNMEGKRGIRGWRWQVYLSGAMTVAFGFFSLWSLPDYPYNTRWITPEERQLAQAWLAEDIGDADEDLAQDFMRKGLKMAIKDLKRLGYSTTITLLLAAPPWIWAAIVCCLIPYMLIKLESVSSTFAWWCVIIGYTMYIRGRNIHHCPPLLALFLKASGHTGFILNPVRESNTFLCPPAKRAAAIGIHGFVCLESKKVPEYGSMEIDIAIFAFNTCLAFVMRCILKNKNRKLDVDETVRLGAISGTVDNAIEVRGVAFNMT